MFLDINGEILPESGATQNWTVSGVGGGLRKGSATNDVFYSISGDTLVGGKGDDTYVLWDPKSTIVEAAGEGIDTIEVRYWGGIALPNNIENVFLKNGGGTWATGNALANVIVAGDVGATLDGGKGNDLLIGGTGADVFKIVSGNGSDVIQNFRPGWDAVKLVGYGFTSFAQIKANAVQVGNDVKIKLSGTETLLLRDTALSSLGAHDFNLPAEAATPAGYSVLTNANAAINQNGWYVLNNAWGVRDMVAGKDYTLSSTYNAADMTRGTMFNWSFDVYTSDLRILAYPEVIFGFSPYNTAGGNPTDTAQVFPVQLNTLTGLKADYDVSYTGNLGGFNVAYDIWLSNSAVATGSSAITNEIMIWLHKGAFGAFGDVVGTYSKDGFTATIYHQGTYTALVADSDKNVGTLDIADILKTLQGLGIVSSSEYLRSIELGAEVASGTGSLTINNFDLQVSTKNADGSTTVKNVDGAGTTVSGMTDVMAGFVADYRPGTSTRYDDNGIVIGTQKVALPGTGQANVTLYDLAGNAIGTDIVRVESATTMTVAHYNAANKLISAEKFVYNADRSVQTVYYDSAWRPSGSDITVVEANGATMIKHYDAKWVFTGAERVTEKGNATLTQHFDTKWSMLSMEQAIHNSDGSTLVQHFDSNAKLMGADSVTVSGATVTTLHYDAKNVLLGSDMVNVNKAGVIKEIDYSAAGKILQVEYWGTDKVDTITGSSSNTHFHGRGGADVLTGGKGVDYFYFDTPVVSGEADKMLSFMQAKDRLVFDDAIFQGIGGPGKIDPNAFTIGKAATDASDRIIYDKTTGSIFYDADGSGAAAHVLIATVSSDLPLTADNFTVI